MSLRESIKTKSAALLKCERVALPDCGLEVEVCGLTQGDARRSGEHKRAIPMQIALSVKDPETHEPLWNPNSGPDLDEIDAMTPVDTATLIEAGNRLSGFDRLKKLLRSQEMMSSPTGSLPTESADEPLPS